MEDLAREDIPAMIEKLSGQFDEVCAISWMKKMIYVYRKYLERLFPRMYGIIPLFPSKRTLRRFVIPFLNFLRNCVFNYRISLFMKII
jgi:hypothetical protein